MSSGSGKSAVKFARVGPVHFQPLEMELAPSAKYLKGRVLNAGCGSRDISDLLKSYRATEVVNYDIESEIPGAIIGSLEKTPFEDNELMPLSATLSWSTCQIFMLFLLSTPVS